MDITALIQAAHPEMSGPLDDLLDRKQRLAMDKVKVQFAADQMVTLQQLIRLAKQDDLPSLKLSEAALAMLMEKLTIRCRADAIEQISRNMGRPLSLVPHFVWAVDLHFYPKRVAVPRSPKAITNIRKDIQSA